MPTQHHRVGAKEGGAMRKLITHLGLPLAVLAAALVLATAPVAASPSRQAGDKDRGKYLVNIIGCLDCHTPIDPNTFQPLPGKTGAGGYPFPVEGLGTVYTKNITSDKETGIGAWTDDELKTAITTGV